jgi:tRNA pseudouridine38-40 synthase
LNNYKLIIQYDGTDYAGWQIQKNAPTVQAEIVKAVKIILGEDVNLLGSGRTDSGVHAFGQSANFRTEKEIDIIRFYLSLNSVLPDAISIVSIEKVEESFHARYDAKSRSYIYLVSKLKSPFFKRYSMFSPRFDKYDFEKLKQLSKLFLGEHDFTSFSRKESDTENKICNVKSIGWRNQKQLVIFHIEADRFLHGMVRTIAGTLLYAVKENKDEDFIKNIFILKDREAAKEAVPSQGLFLYKVRY